MSMELHMDITELVKDLREHWIQIQRETRQHILKVCFHVLRTLVLQDASLMFVPHMFLKCAS